MMQHILQEGDSAVHGDNVVVCYLHLNCMEIKQIKCKGGGYA